MIPKINSSHGAETRNIINRVIEVLNQQGKSLQDLVAEGQLTEEQYAELLTTINSLVKSGNVDKSDLTPEFQGEIEVFNTQLAQKTNKGEIQKSDYDLSKDKNRWNINDFDEETRKTFLEAQGIDVNQTLGKDVVTKENITDRAVTIDKLDFTNRNDVNLFDGNYVKDAAIYRDLAFGVQPYLFNSTGGVVAVVPVTGGKKYFVRRFDVSDRFRISGMIDDPVFQNEEVDYVYYQRDEPDKLMIEVATNPDVKYLVIQVSVTGQMPRLQITENIDSEKYLSPKTLDKSYLPTVEIGDLIFMKPSDNLFDGNYVNKGLYVWGSNLYLVNNYEGYSFKSAIVPIEPHEKYVITLPEGGNNRFRVGVHNSYPVTTGVDNDSYDPSNETPLDRFIVNDNSAKQYEFTNSGTGRYLVVAVSSQVNEPKLLIQKDAYKAPFVIRSEYIENGKNIVADETENNRYKTFLYGDFTSLYRTRPYEDEVKESVLRDTLANDVYREYDNLVTAFPNYVSRNFLGNDDDSNHIYEYVFSAPNDALDTTKKSPLVLISSGVHGSEKPAVWGSLQFFKQLCNNWEEYDNLASLKSNVTFKVIPVVTPSAYNISNRQKPNGVNVNRNFSYNWEESDESGTAPYTEPEAIILRDWWLSNQDALMYIDYHTFIDWRGVPTNASYLNTNNDEVAHVYSSVLRRISDLWRKEYFGDRDNLAYGYISNEQMSMAWNEAREVAGIEMSVTLESSRKPEGFVLDSKETIEMSVDILANYILAMLNYFNQK